MRRILIMAEMHGRDLTRRHVALGLLVALPLSFYLASSRDSSQALSAGGIGMAFAVSGATLFSVLSSQGVDQQLVLGGYRPIELLVGRLLFLGPLGLVIAAGFTALMSAVSHPARPAVLVLGVALVALQSVPFGLAVGSALPRELEGTLVLIGVVGMQLAVGPDAGVAKVLPFYGPRQLIEAATGNGGAVLVPVAQTAVYGVALLLVARVFMDRHIAVEHHPRIDPPTPTDG
ncbi:ABC transporter permease [Aquihabitans sp. G128]|uniref:ABC transporter permease n=1 Tax=Aquihabitans sp. G128 TaxID=2849779 RepID=UPI001C22673D|nr:ABC transporter permease [Aquihabitans sp. G128]QXC59667.1 ABC transporter permease [Aquihabitans sp. G128]